VSTTAQIVIVGGGVTGASTAFHLTQRRPGRIILVERSTAGAGPTAKTIGIIRLHYSYEPLIHLAMRGLEFFERFEAHTGGTADFVRAGFLLLARPDQLRGVEANVALQQRLGVKTSMLTPAEVVRVDPRMNVEDVGGAAYEPGSGYADGYAATAGFLAAARRQGLELWEHTAAEGVLVRNGRIAGLATSQGIIETAQVLVAAGPWTPALLATVDLSLPIQASRQQVVQLSPPAGFGSLGVVIEDMTQGFYARPESGASVLAGVLEEEAEQIVSPENFNQGVDFDFVRRVGMLWAHRYPAAGDAEVRGGYASVYDLTPDWQPILGAVPGIEGLYVAAGFSGHGFKLSPALGSCLAALLCGAAPEIDIAPFAPTRFAAGRLIRGRHAQGILG
jgi:glycine/D-amino acid oxidase-like deaminating enzyme